ncbi:MAG TPA: efflux RND transporter periplasmic adaptor subunit, partial [Candidatus Acidoferrum sp.]|nr:efflux RND transporter periplasmic adaptor subunit [Candidatus Acidoferrum sp.]
MKKLRFWAIILGLVIVVVVAWYWFGSSANSKVVYRTDKVDRGTILVSITATGTLDADTTVDVGTQVSGTIAKLYADFNSVVKKGQLLAQLDPTFLQANVEQQQANVDRAQASVDDAQRTYKRTSDLFAKGLAAQSDLDAATTALQTNQAALRQAQAAMLGSKVNLQYATIYSPISGVVISRNVDVGQTVAASLSAPTLFQIANDLTKMQLQASIDEADIGSVKVGQHVTFRVDAYPDQDFVGSVRQVRLAPVTTQNVVTYNVIIDVSNPDLKLMPGMTATVTVEVDRRDDVVRVPLQALRFTPPNVQLASVDQSSPAPAADPDSSGNGRQHHWRDSTGAGGGAQAAEGQGRWRQRSDSAHGGQAGQVAAGGSHSGQKSANFGRVW